MNNGWKEETFWKKFWERVDRNGGPDACWIWKGSRKGGKKRSGEDYGYVWKTGKDGKKRKVLAHRLSWEWYNEESAGVRCVLHRCDNPPCVNYRHLFVGTKVDNAKDMWRKKRSPVGEKAGQAKLTGNQVLEIQKLLRAGIWVADIARHYKVHHATIDGIAKGRQWRSLGVVKLKKRRPGVGIRCGVVEGSESCTSRAATKVRMESGEIQYLCSGHGLSVVLKGLGVEKAEAMV